MRDVRQAGSAEVRREQEGFEDGVVIFKPLTRAAQRGADRNPHGFLRVVAPLHVGKRAVAQMKVKRGGDGAATQGTCGMIEGLFAHQVVAPFLRAEHRAQAGLLAQFPDGAGQERLVNVEKAARKGKLAFARVDAPADCEDVPAADYDRVGRIKRGGKGEDAQAARYARMSRHSD